MSPSCEASLLLKCIHTVNFKAVFLRIAFRQMIGAPSLYQTITRQLMELGSCLWHQRKAHTIVFHNVPLFQNVIFRYIPHFDGMGPN